MSVFTLIDVTKLAYLKRRKEQNVAGLLKCRGELTKTEVERY